MTEHPREYLLERCRALVSAHKGPDDCITMTELYHQLTGEVVIPWRRYDQSRIVRSLIEQLRREGCPIGHKGGKFGGYFWAADQAELDTTARMFRSRGLSAFKQEAALRRVSNTELLKQYQLDLKEEANNG